MGERRYGDQDYTGTFELTKDKEDIVVTGVLPPGQEATDQRVHGTLSLAIKQLAWLNLKLNQDFIRFKPCFWGDERQQILLRADNTALDEKLVLKHTVDYHVRCQILQFHKYLSDMGKLKILLIDSRNNKPIAFILINFVLFLKKTMDAQDSTPFNKIRGMFPIMKLPLAHEIESFPPKVGEVEIEIKCLFDPTLKLQNALDLKRQQKDKQSLARERESRSKEDAVERLEKARRARAAIAQPEGSNDLDKLIEKSETLKRKMMASERNKEFPLETDVDQLLYDGVAGEGYADFPKLSKMKYKEAELESLRLATMHPQFEFGESNKSEQKGKATFNDIKKLFLEVFTVDFENQTLKDRLKGQNLSLQLKLPKFIGEKLQEDIFIFKGVEDSENLGMFRFNKEIKVSYEAQKIGVERLSKCKGSILIQMIMDKTVAQEKTKSKGKSEQTEKNNGILTIDVAKGSFDFNDILMNKRFTLQTKLNLDSLITLDKKKNELKGKKDKKDSAANQDLLPKNVGWVHMDIRLGREDRGQDLTDEESDCEELAYDAWENEKVSKEKIANRGKAKGSKHDPAIIEVQNKKEFESRTSTESLLPVCLFLHVLRAVKTTSRPKSRISRNLYIKHKIYGTPDDITSQVFWNQSSPDIDHRAVVPMTNHTIKLMEEAPLTISVWDKMESGTEAKDELVGFCNINLKPLFGLLSPLSLEDLKAFLHNQGNDLLELTNKYMEIQTLRAGEVQGYLKVYLGAGNIKQIGFYNKAHLSNDSRLIGVDPMTFGFGSDKIPLRRRDPKKKTAFKFNLSDLEFLAKNPYLKSILDSLIQQLNSGQIAVEEFHLKILGEVMKKFPDPEIIAFLHELLPRAEECNPIWVPEYSRKPYITRDSHQFQYDSKDKKFYQIVENGERVPMQRCVFKGPQMKEEEVFVDKKAMIIKKNDKAIRKISKRQMKELKMLNGEIPEAPEEEEMDVPVYSVPEGADVDALIRKALNLREFERLKKLEKEKAEADQMRKNETGDAKPELEKSYPSGERSNQGSLSNWSKVKNKLMSQKALVNRSEEMYGDKSHENSVIAEMNTPMNRKMKVRVGARVHTPNITNDWKNDSSASSVRRNGSMDSGKPDDKEQSDSKHFELIKVGMALYGGRSISDLSEDEMSSVVQLKNIQLIDEESRSFEMPNSEIEQYATDLGDAFISDDVLMSFTILLEYLRRFVMSNQDLRKRMKYLLLGQFQSSLSKEIGFEDLEYILRNYLVEIDQKEAKSLFTFLCEKKTNMLNLVDLHDSLFTYIKLYLEYTTEYLTPLHYVLQKVTQKPQGMQDLIEFMCAHSVDMHIDKSTLFSYLENVAEINNLDLIEHQLLEFGEFVYFDRIYIVNIINILLFLKEQGDRKFDPHYIKALHSYEAYFKLVARKIKDHAHQLYAEKDPTLEVIGLFQKIDLEFTNGRESPGLSKHESDESQSNTDSKGSKEVGYNLGQFREVIGRLGFKDITVFETMIIFYFIHDMRTKLRLGLKKGQKLASRDIELFFKIVLADQPALVEGVAELNLNWALEGLVKTGALQSLIKDQSFVSRGSKATKRKKLKTELIETNRVVYNLTFNIRGLESLALASDFDYADLSIRFNFPGEEAPFETQLFTYIPSETNYDAYLNSEHIYRCKEDFDISDIFNEVREIRVSLQKVTRSHTVEVGYCLIPFKDVLSPHLVCRKYLLYSLNSNPGRTNLGAVSLNFNSQAYKETLTEKDLYFKKRFLVNESWVEKDVNFERDIPRTGFLIIAVNKVARFEQMLQLLANIKQDLRLDMKKTEHRLRLELRVNEADEDVSKVVFRKREPSIIKEEREDSQDSERDNQGKVEELEEPFKFQEMVIPIRSKTINSLEDAFEFLDTLGREGVSLYHLSKSDVRLTDQALDYLQSRELEFSLVLYLESDLHSANYVCGKAIEPFSTFLTTQNNAGHQKSLALVNGSGGQICELDTLLNYTKVFHDDLFIDTMNKYNEYREAFDQVRQRTLVINLVNIVYQSRQPKQRARNKLFFLKARVGALVEVTYLIDSTENETITESYLNLENNKNVIVLRLVDLYLEDDIHSLYQDFVKKEGRVAVQQHVAESVPSLDLTLIEKSLQGTEEQIGYLSIDLRHMLLSSLGGPGERTDWYKGLLPFEASPATKCFQPLREPSISEGTFTTEERSKSVPMDLLGLFSQSPEAASVVLVNARVGLKMLVINERSAGLFRAEDYECLRRLLNIDWCQDVERFATRVGLYGTGIEGDELDMGAHGFIAKQAVLTKMLREHLKVPLNHLESLVGIIGSDEQKVEMLNLQHLLRNPISSALTLDARNIERKFVEELLVEFRYVDVNTTGYVTFNDATKILLQYQGNHKISSRQIHSFKMSSLLGDFKKSVREGLRKLGDHEGFDYLIFLSRILSYMQQADEQRRVKLGRESREFEKGLRSVEQAIEQFHWSHDQKEGPHLTLDGQCQGGSFKARSPDTEKKTLTVKLPGDYNSTRKLGRLAGNGPDSIPGPCNLSITALKGLNIHIPCHENFPNTLIEMSLVTNEVVHFSKKSELMLRQADPNWNCSHRLTVESLEEFIEVNTPLQLVLKLYLRRYGRLASEGLFVTEEIGTAKLDFSDLINADELRSLLLGQRKTVLTTIKVALGKLGGAVEVQCELTASDRDSLAESWQATQVQPLEHLKGTLKEVRRLPEREGMEGYDITQIGLQNLMLTLKEVNQENRYSTEHEVEAWAKEDRFEGLRNWRDDWKNTVERLKSKDPEELSISFENRRSISVADIGFYNPSGSNLLRDTSRMEGPETDRPPGQNIHIQDFEGGSFMQESGHKRRPSQLVRSQTNPKQNDRLVEEIASELEIESPDNIRF